MVLRAYAAPKEARLIPATGRSSGCLGQRFYPAKQILFARHPGNLISKLPVLEEQQRRNCTDIVFEGEALVFVDVHFCHFHRIGFFAGNLVQQWRDQFAGAAPFRPEIHQDWFVAVDFAVKVRFVEIDCGRVLRSHQEI
jgi:hypothetical protein